MARFEIGVKDVLSGNIYYAGYTISASNREAAIDEYLETNQLTQRKLVYANMV